MSNNHNNFADSYYFSNKYHNDYNLYISHFLLADSLFLAIVNETSVSISSGDPIIWDEAPINPGGNFNTALGLYQAPIHGYYT